MPTVPAPGADSAAGYEARILTLVNLERSKQGLPALELASCADRYAETWAAHLASTGDFDHQQLTPIMDGCSADRASENIARGDVSPDEMVQMWMDSPGHRANILDPDVDAVGIAAVRSGGEWTGVQDFVHR